MSLDADAVKAIAQAFKDLVTPTAAQGGAATVSAVGPPLKLPQFWTAKPELWFKFKQVESQFSTRKITGDKTKFDYVVQSLDNSTAAEVESIIIDPPTEDSYEVLKTALNKAFGKSQARKDMELLTMGGLGDRTPTSLLRHMTSLNTDPQTLFRALFLSKLPLEVQTVLAASEETDISKLAEQADRMVENSRMRNASASALGVSAAKTQPPQPPQGQQQRHKGNNHKPASQPAAPGEPGGFCFYHAKYGNKARKCPKPTCPMHHTISSAQASDEVPENFQASRM